MTFTFYLFLALSIAVLLFYVNSAKARRNTKNPCYKTYIKGEKSAIRQQKVPVESLKF